MAKRIEVTPSKGHLEEGTSPADPAGTKAAAAESSRDSTKALAEMLPLVYEELRLLAGGYLRNERPEHTLQRTAITGLRLGASRA